MSYNQKKFETPIELHKTLGNKYVVEVHQRNAMRKQIISELNATAKAQKHAARYGQTVPTLNQYFDAAMLNKQLQLELELERLRSSIREPTAPQEQPVDNPSVPESPSRGSSSASTQFTHVLPTIQSAKETPPSTISEPSVLKMSTKAEPAYSPAPPNSVKNAPSTKGDPGKSMRNDNNSTKASTKASKPDFSTSNAGGSSTKAAVQQSTKVKKQPTEPTITETDSSSSRSFGYVSVKVNNEELEIPEVVEVARSAPNPRAGKSTKSSRNVVSAEGASQTPKPAEITTQSARITSTPPLAIDEPPARGSAPSTPAHEPVAPQWHNTSPASSNFVAMSPESVQAMRAGSAESLRNDSAGLMHVPISSMSSTPYTQHSTAPGAMHVPFPLPSSASGAQMTFSNTSLAGFGLGLGSNNNKFHQNSAAGNGMNLMNSWPHSAQSSMMSYSPVAPNSMGGARLFPGVVNNFPSKYNPEPTPPKGLKYNMFVLSAAPKVSFDSMVASEMNAFSHQPSPYGPYAGSMGGTLDSSVMSDDVPNGSTIKTEMTIQDQIYRFAEIRSLFQMPTDSGIDDTYLEGGKPRGSSPHRSVNLVDEAANAKLQESIDRHRLRLQKSRKPKPSPRSQIHKPKYPAYPPDSDYYHNFETSQSARGTSSLQMPAMPGTSASSSSAAGDLIPAMEGVSLVDSSPVKAAESAVQTAPSSSASARLSTGASASKRNVASAVGSSRGGLASAKAGGDSGMDETKASESADDAKSATDGAAADPPQSAVPTTAPATAVSPTEVEPDMSVEEFQQKANKIDEALRKTVSSVVKHEILVDGQSQHFTKRMQQQTLAKAKKPLAKKIEAKVEERLAELKKEIEMLRAAKVASPPKQNHGSGSEEGSDEEEGENEGHEHEEGDQHNGSWFKNNELTLKTKKSKSKAPKIDLDFTSISQDIKKSVESVILKHWKTHGGGPSYEERMEMEAESRKLAEEAAEHDTIGFGAATPTKRSPKASDNPNSRSPRNSVSHPDTSATGTPIAAPAPVEEEEAPKPKKLSKAERMLGITAEPPMLSTRNGPSMPEQSNKVGMLSSLGSMFGSKSSVKPQELQPPPSFHLPPAAAGTVRFKGNKISTLKPIVDEEEEELSAGRQASPSAHISGRSVKVSMASFSSQQSGVSHRSRHESSRSVNFELTAAEMELRAASQKLNNLNETKSKLKKELKDWQKGFEARVGRPPNDADKSAIEDRFLAYQKVTSDLKDAASVLKEAEQKVNDLKGEA